jgi:hypothetical protein
MIKMARKTKMARKSKYMNNYAEIEVRKGPDGKIEEVKIRSNLMHMKAVRAHKSIGDNDE